MYSVVFSCVVSCSLLSALRCAVVSVSRVCDCVRFVMEYFVSVSMFVVEMISVGLLSVCVVVRVLVVCLCVVD